jgi:adenylate kinase family enzyme
LTRLQSNFGAPINLQELDMRKVAVFGNAGGGKSTLARRLAEITGLPLYVIDIIQYSDGVFQADKKDGGKVSPEEYARMHRNILSREDWIIDGYGSVASAWERFGVADTLVYIDLPMLAHYWGVTKRLLGGMISNPKGWPENSPVWESSLDGYQVVWQCHRRLTPKYRQLVADMASSKRVHHLRSRSEVAAFIQSVVDEQRHRHS